MAERIFNSRYYSYLKMMNMPFFSIIIPTKNRPKLLRVAISSVLLQDFDDYELIVSDNFNDKETKNAISEFSGNLHIHYVRTERELNIPDHWEFATRKAKGVYTLILTDRAFLRQNSLRDIHDTITASGDAPVVFWKYGYFDEKGGILRGEKEEAGIKMLKSIELIKNFGRTLDAHYLPRPHVGCYRHDVAEKIRRTIGRLYLPYGPDYTSALLFLAYSDDIMYIPRPFAFFQGTMLSSGLQAQSDISPYLNSLNVPDPYQFVPIKAPINTNLLFNDLVKIRNIAAGNLMHIDINWVYYFGMCYQTLMERKIIWGADKGQVEFWEEWGRALASFDGQFQKEVRKEVRKRWLKILKSYIRKTLIGNFLVKIRRTFLGVPTRFYPSALTAGGFET